MKSKLLVWAALLLILGANAAALYRWVNTDTRPAAWDQSIHLKNALDYRERLAVEGPFSVFQPSYFNYPPLYHLSLVPCLNRVEEIADSGALANFVYFVLLIIGIYLLGDYFGRPWEGVVAAFLFSSYPLVFDMATQPMIDLALTMWVTLSFYFLVKSENFTRLIWGVAFSVSFAGGMLTKWTTFIYLSGPLVLVVYRNFRERTLWRCLLPFSITGILILPWYLINLPVLMTRLPHVAGLPSASGASLSWMNDFFWYPLSLFEQINFVFVLFFIPALAMGLLLRKIRPLLFWFFGSLLLLSLIPNHNTRYFLPVLPAVALLSVTWLPGIFNFPLKITGALIFSFFSIFHLFPTKSYYLKTGSFPIPLMSWHAPAAENWQHDDIMGTIANALPPEARHAQVLTVSNAPYLHSTTLNLSLRTKGITTFQFRGPSKKRWFELMDFILFKTGDLGPAFSIKTIRECADVIEKKPDWFGRVFQEIKRWPLPDGSEAILFQKNPMPVKNTFSGKMTFSLDQFNIPNVRAENLVFTAVPEGVSQSVVGQLKKIELRADKIYYKEFPLEEVQVDLIQPQINLPLFLETQEVQLLRISSINPKGKISASSLLEYLSRKAKWLKRPILSLEQDEFGVSGLAYGLPIRIRVRIKIQNSNLVTELIQFKLLGVPIPRFLLVPTLNKTIPLQAHNDMPYNIGIHSIQGGQGEIHIN